MKKLFITIIIIILVVGAFFFLKDHRREGNVIGDSDNNNSNSENSTTSNQINGNNMAKKIESDNYCEGKTGQKACPEKNEEIAVINTNYGTIKIKLFEDEAPKTVTNFKKLIKEGFYDNLIFHRIIEGFMIQGGDPEGAGSGGPGYTVDAEISEKLSHVAGAVACARLSDAINPEKASSGSQFYIVHNDTGAKSLDGDYTIFGQVIAGQNVVEAIAEVATDSSDKPLEDVVIEKTSIELY